MANLATINNNLLADSGIDPITVVTGSGIAGQVAFWSGTTTQAGSNSLFWDNVNNRLGIGINTPSVDLHLEKTSSPIFRIARTGGTILNLSSSVTATGAQISTGSLSPINFGINGIIAMTLSTSSNLLIGTTVDTGTGQKLQVTGTSLFTDSATFSKVYTNSSDLGVIISATIPGINLRTPSSGRISLISNYNSANSASIVSGTGTNNPTALQMFFDFTNLRVGIGTPTPNTKLDVLGAASIAGGNDGLRIGNVGDNSAYDNVKIYYTGFNAGAPRVYLTPRTTPGSGVVESFFHIQNSNGNSTTSNNTMGLLVDGSVGIGNIAPTQKLHVTGSIRVTGAYYDSNNSAGTVGQVLSSTATGTDWVSLSEITGVDGTGTANYIAKWLDANTITDSLLQEGTNSIGLGVTPQAWESVSRALQIGTTGSISSNTSDYRTTIAANAYIATSGAATYLVNAAASQYMQISGTHRWFYAPSGTGAITFSEAMRITAAGDVGIGTTAPAYKLETIGIIRASSDIISSGSFRSSTYDYAASLTFSDIELYSSAVNATDRLIDFGDEVRGWTITALQNGGGTTRLSLNTRSFNVLTESVRFDLNAPTNGGTVLNIIPSGVSFAPTSGTSIFNAISLTPTINQTGGANGITRGLLINPTLTAAADWRSIEIANSSGWGIYQTGNIVNNYINGNLGIGTTSIERKLHVLGDVLVAGTSGGIYFKDNTNTPFLWVQDAQGLRFGTNNTERMRITATGDVGIGTSAPNVKLDVNGTLDLRNAFQGYARLAPSAGNGSQARLTIRLKPVDTAEVVMASLVQDGSVGLGGNITDTISMAGSFLSIASNGQTRLRNYGVGTFTGTVAYNLAVDASGNVIETAGGVVDGSGTANYISKWQDANTLTNSLLFDNGTNVGIGTTSPSSILNVVGTTTISGKIIAGDVSAISGQMTLEQVYSAGNVIGSISTRYGSGAMILGYGARGKNGADGYTSTFSNFSGRRAVFEVNQGYFQFLNTAAVNTAIGGDLTTSTLMYISDTGNVGIGTASPVRKLDIINPTGPQIRLSDGTAGSFWELYSTFFSTQQDFFIQNQNGTAVTINASRNVGIGTTAPATKLEVFDSVTTQLRVRMSGQADMRIIADTGYGAISNDSNMPLVLRTNATERMRISATGNVGIGTSTPAYSLDVNGAIRIPNSNYIYINNAAGTAIQAIFMDSGDNLVINTSTGGDLYLRSGGNTVFRALSNGDVNIGGLSATASPLFKILNNGNVGVGTTAPAARLDIVGTNVLGIRYNRTDGAAADARIVLQSGTASTNIHQYGESHASLASIFRISSSGGIEFLTSGVAAARITTAQNFLIGSSSDDTVNKLQVTGGVRVAGSTAFNGNMTNAFASLAGGVTVIGGITGVSNGFRIDVNTSNEYQYAFRSGANALLATIANTGDVFLNTYGTGAKTGTVAYNLAVDASGKIIETAGGVVDGSGTATYLSKWQDANTLTNSLLYENGTNIVNIATASTRNVMFRLYSNGQTNNQLEIGQGLSALTDNIGYVFNTASAALAFGTAYTERMRISSTGDVGIGTTTPSYKLHVVGSFGAATSGVTLEYNSGILYHGGSYYQFPSGGYYNIYGRSGMGLIFGSNNAEAARFDLSGNLGIGTTAPNQKLQVAGFVNAQGYVNNGVTFRKSFYLGNIAAGATTALGLLTFGSVFTHHFRVTITSYYGTKTVEFIGYQGTMGKATYGFAGGGGEVVIEAVYVSTNINAVKIGVTSAVQDYVYTATVECMSLFGSWVDYAAAEPITPTTLGSSTTLLGLGNSFVGVNTNNPLYNLHVVSSSATIGAFRNSGAAIGQLLVGNTAGDLQLRVLATGDGLIMSDTSKYLALGSNGTERLRITSAGDVGIGTTAPAYKLHVVGTLGVGGDTDAPFGATIANSNLGTSARTRLTLDGQGGTWHIDNQRIGGVLSFTRVSTEYFSINNVGLLRLNAYGTGARTGTVAYNLAVDASGNVIETAGGVVDGSGTANYVSKWSDPNTLTDSVLYDSGTNIGIGTSTPIAYFNNALAARALQIVGNGRTGINFQDSSAINQYLNIGVNGANAFIEAVYSTTPTINYNAYSAHVFITGSTPSEKMRLTANGRLAIGTTSPTQTLHVQGTFRSYFDAFNYIILDGTNLTMAANAAIIIGDNSTDSVTIGVATGETRPTTINGGPIYFQTTSTTRMTIAQNGDVGIGTTTGDPFSRGYTRVLGISTATASGSTAIELNGGSGGYGQIDFGAGGIRTAGISGSANETQWGSLTAIPAIIYTNSAEKMRITSAGDVGIGTSTVNGFWPSNLSRGDAKLGVYYNDASTSLNNANAGLVILNTNTTAGTSSKLVFGAYNIDPVPVALAYISATNDLRSSGYMRASLIFATESANGNATGPTEKMRLTPEGNVGIGTTAPTAPLDILTTTYFTTALLRTTQASNYLTLTNSGGQASVFSTGDALAFSTTGSVTERMRITSAGNVGIGTSAPTTSLVVRGNTSGYNKDIIVWERATDGAVQGTLGFGKPVVAGDENNIFVGSITNHPLLLITNNTEKLRVTTSGNVGIGTSTPAYKLDIISAAGGSIETIRVNNGFTAVSDGSQLLLGNSVNFTNAFFRLNGGGNTSQAGIGSLNIGLVEASPMAFYTANTERMRIAANGNVGIGTSAPTAALQVVRDGGASTVRLLQLDNTNVTYSQNVYLDMNISKDILWGQGSAGGGTFWNAGTRGYGWSINGTRIVTYDLNGNVGIGTSTPTSILDASISSGATSGFRFKGYSDASTPYLLSLGTHTYQDIFQIKSVNGLVTMGIVGAIGTTPDLAFQTNTTERMRITSSGSLLIGTTQRLGLDTNTNRLQVIGGITVGNGLSTYVYATLQYSTNDFVITGNAHPANVGDNSIIFRTGSSGGGGPLEHMRIVSTGNVGIGTTSPAQKLDVNGDALINGIRVGRGPNSIAGNIVLGTSALNGVTTGGNNTAIGAFALRSTTTGTYNIAIGPSAGGIGVNENTTGSLNIFIGAECQGESATDSNRTWIGSNTTTSTWLAGNLLLGSKSNTGERIQVTGTMKVTAASTFGGTLTVNSSLLAAQTNGSLILRELGNNAANNAIEVHVRPNAGKSGYLTFTENAIADRWAIGISNGNGNLKFIAGTALGTEVMTLTSAGNLGIGTSAPAYKLDVNGTFRVTGESVLANGALTVSNTSANSSVIINTGNSLSSLLTFSRNSVTQYLIGMDTTNNFRFNTYNAGAFVGCAIFIPTATTRVLINSVTDDTINTLQVSGTGRFTSNVLAAAFIPEAGTTPSNGMYLPTTNVLGFSTNSTLRLSVKANGQVRFAPLASDPAGAEAGDVYYNSTTNVLKYSNGTTWNDMAPSSSSYTPTLTLGTNAASGFVSTLNYFKNGSMVHIIGKVTITSSTNAPTTIYLSLPIASAFTDNADAVGFGDLSTIVAADVTNDRLEFYLDGSTTSTEYGFMLTYVIK